MGNRPFEFLPPFCSMVTHKQMVWTSALQFHSKGERIWYDLKSWKSPHLPALRFHSNSRLSDFLPSCFPFLNLYKYWQNFEDSVEVSLNPNSSCAPFFFLMLLFPFLHFVTTFFVLCVDDCYAEILFTGVFNWSSVIYINRFNTYRQRFIWIDSNEDLTLNGDWCCFNKLGRCSLHWSHVRVPPPHEVLLQTRQAPYSHWYFFHALCLNFGFWCWNPSRSDNTMCLWW